MSNGKKTNPKRPAKAAPTRPPSVPKPSEVSAPAKAKAPAPKRAGKRPLDPKARAERKQQQRWFLALAGLVALLVVLVLANAWLLRGQGAGTSTGTATATTQATTGTPAALSTGLAIGTPEASATP